MKKLTLSMAAIAAAGTFAVAGGDIAPVEPVVETPVVAPSDAGFYVGLAYGYVNEEMTRTENGAKVTPDLSFDESFSTIMLQGGYKVNPYIAVEARYWIGLDDTTPTNYTKAVDAPEGYGLYVKPMYPVTDAFDIYALLGYANIDTSINKMDGFSWGLGASYDVTSNVSLFVDYTLLIDDDTSFTKAGVTTKKDYKVDAWNFGVSYKF